MTTSFEMGTHSRSFTNDSMTLAGHEPYIQADPQENPTSSKTSPADSTSRQRTPSDSRAPLSATSTSQKNNGGSAKSTQARSNGTTRPVSGAKPAPFPFDPRDTSLKRKESYDDIPENMYRPEKSDREGWIHREKLAKIESEELQVAGINLAKARSRSRDALGERLNPSASSGNPQQESDTLQPEVKRQKTLSLDASEQEDDDRQNWDFRTPDEIAAEQVAGYTYVSPVLRKSGSKIPIMTSSPTPIPAERYAREIPMPRKRTMSGTLAPDDSLMVPKSRNGGMDTDTTPSGSMNSSPTKSRTRSTTESRPGTSSGTKPGTTTRKPSAPVKATASLSSGDGKPIGRGNDPERPKTTTNRPEGDPPWLATMYKHDPMLPPDQQIIPTLARKQQQEQWAREGHAPTTYDRNFDPLAVYDGSDVQQERSRESQRMVGGPNVEQSDDGASKQWPLRTSSNPPGAQSAIEAETNPDQSGESGYSISANAIERQRTLSVPNSHNRSPHGDRGSKRLSGVDRHKQAGSSSTPGEKLAGPRSNTAGVQVTRMQQSTEKDDENLDKKKGGCCCCIVM